MRKYLSEFLGTFVLVFCGCGSMLATYFLISAMGMTIPLAFTIVAVALAFGATTSVVYYLFKEVSGAHINPAVSIAVLINGGFEKKKQCIGYLIAQFAGSTIAACILWLVTGQKYYLGQNGYDDQSSLYIGMVSAIVIEIILTMVLVMVFLKVSNSKNENTAAGSIVLGITTTALYMAALPFTGASLNPARSFGPAIIMLSDAIKQVPVFIIAPVVGAIIAAFLYKGLVCGEKIIKPKEKVAEGTDETENKEVKEKKGFFRKKSKKVKIEETEKTEEK